MKPFTYHVEVSGSCNLKCPSCPQGNSPQVDHTRGFMDVNLFRKIIDKIAHEPVSVKRVSLFNWGEVFLHPKLAELISIVKSHNLFCHLSSNFNHINNLEEVIAARPDALRISISGFTNDTYQRTHRKGNIEQVKKNMILLRKVLNSYASQTMIEVNYHKYLHNTGKELSEMSCFATKLGFPFTTAWAYLMPMEKYLAFFMETLSQQDKKLIDMLAIKPDLLKKICLPFSESDCKLRSNQTAINSDGSVALCCTTFDKKYNIAGNFLEISHDDLQKLKNLHPLCGECMSHGIHMGAVYEPYDAIDRAAQENVAAFNRAYSFVNRKDKDPSGDHRPLISIGLPTYNGETFLRQALDSLLAQDYENFEIIIADNASTDGTAAICWEYAEKDKRIKFFQNPKNMGATDNFTRVRDLATGKYFMWATDHDLWHPTLLSKATAILESDASVVLCYPRAERIDGEGRSLGLAANTMDTRGLSAVARYAYLLNNLSVGDMICGLIRLEALKSLDPKTVWGADQAILAGLALQGTFAHLPEPLFSWRKIRDESLEYRKKTVPLTLDPKDSQGMLAMSMVELWRQLGEECLAQVKASDLPELEKERLVKETKTIFTRRYGVQWPACAAAVEDKESPEKTCAVVLPATAAAPSPSAPDLPLVSVIVSTCSRPDRLAPVLQSLLKQTYKHYEIIVVNDCGIANNNIAGWLNQQGNIAYVRHERQRGVTAARDTGLKLSRGKYIAYLDEDDSFGPNHLENLVTSLESSDSTSPPEG